MLPRKNNAERVFFKILSKDDAGVISDELRRLSDDTWEQLLRLAIKTALVPAFYKRLLALNFKNIPQGITANLKNTYLFNLKRNLILEHELFKVISFFKENSITAIPLKGPVLAKYLYGDIALRSAPVDLDILVKEKDFLKAKDLSEKLGYGLLARNNNEFFCNFDLKYSRQLLFKKHNGQEGNLFLELHYDLRGVFVYAPLDDFWQGLSEFDTGKIIVLMPTKENLLLYMCLAVMPITEFIEVRYIFDLHTLISRYGKEINWRQLKRKLEGSRHESCVYFALKLSQKLFRTNIPIGFPEKLKPGIIKTATLSLWVNKNNVLCIKYDRSLRWYYFFTSWHYFASSLLYSRNFPDCIRIINKKIFLPKTEVENLYSTPGSSKILPLLYLKRILKPLTRIFNN